VATLFVRITTSFLLFLSLNGILSPFLVDICISSRIRKIGHVQPHIIEDLIINIDFALNQTAEDGCQHSDMLIIFVSIFIVEA
jgi:hypothetical protein